MNHAPAILAAPAVYRRGYLWNAESCQGVICGKSSAERSANYPLSLFRIPLLTNSAFPRIAKLPFARIVQLMCSPSIATSGVPRCLPSVFFVVCLPKNRVFFTISINFKVSSTFPSVTSFHRSIWLASICIIGANGVTVAATIAWTKHV